MFFLKGCSFNKTKSSVLEIFKKWGFTTKTLTDILSGTRNTSFDFFLDFLF